MAKTKRAAWVILAVWFLISLITLNYNGPFFDEAIYITAGYRTLEGHGLTDGYMRWFAGTLIWPVLAALGYQAAGLIGTRIVALMLGAIAFAAVVEAADNLFGRRAAIWTAVVVAVSGPFLALARLGVYDILALAGIAVAFWAVTQTVASGSRAWIGVAAVAFMIAVISKYPVGIMALPILAVLVILRSRRAGLDLALFGLTAGAVGLATILPLRQELAAWVEWTVANKPVFGITPAMMLFTIVFYTSIPALLALAGLVVARGRRTLAAALMLSLLIWPAYHLLSGNPVSLNKHLVFGLIFVFPLAGVAFASVWFRNWLRPVVVLGVIALAFLAVVQVDQADHSWPDVRPGAGYLAQRVQPGDQLLINESWPYTMYLYTEGRISSPWDVYDVYRVTHDEAPIGLCEFDWVVDSRGSYSWPEEIRADISACPGFEPVYAHGYVITALSPQLTYIAHPVNTVISQQSRPELAR